MQRVLVIGPGGAGKTTVAVALAELRGLPLVHLDALYWRTGWQASPADEWERVVDTAIAAPRWVMDGNYGGTLRKRVQAADTIVFLDLPRIICILRVLRRRLAYAGRSRPSMPVGCPERVTLEFLRWIWTYRARRRPTVLNLLKEVGAEKRIVVLRSRREVQHYLSGLAEASAPGEPAV